MVEGEEKLVKAGKVAREMLELAKKKARIGMPLLELAEELESNIAKAGVSPAFPVNLSVNEEAAHRTPRIGEGTVIGEKDVLKVDVGTHFDGFIADSAVSIDFSGENGKLVEAADKALENALSIMRSGTSVRKIGEEIQKTITHYGFKPIENLSGHSLEQFGLHAGIEIPNIPRGDYVLQEGDVFAVEPFATNGLGAVVEGSLCEIFSIHTPRSVRLPGSRKLLEFVSAYGGMPFPKRWLKDVLPQPSLDLALADLSRQGILHSYPILIEEKRGLVAQAETSVIVEKDSVKVLV